MTAAVATNSPAKVLVLDDDADLRAMLQRYLGDNGYAVRVASNRVQLERLLQREPFDVLVLDLMLPGDNGLDICRHLRAQGETLPILMLTARGDPVDRVIGLEIGADDYLPKPFNPRELLARIHAMVRRQTLLGAAAAGAGPLRDATLHFGDFTLDLGARRLCRGNEPIALTSGELELLATLASHAGRPLGRERLIEATRRRQPDAQGRSIDVQILRLRRAIEADPADPRFIQTVWGVGYVFVPDGERV